MYIERYGTSHLVERKIELMTKGPIHVRPYPIPYAKRQEVEIEVQTMQEADVIEPVMSDYNPPPPEGGGTLIFLHTKARAQNLPFTKKKISGISSTPKIFEILAIQKIPNSVP